MKDNYTKIFIALFLVLLINYTLNAQMSAPKAEAVYGGSINAIEGISTGTDSSRIFISTSSANSLFYADMHVSATGIPTFGSFSVFSGADAKAGFGDNISKLSAHQASGSLFFIANNALYQIKDPSSNADSITMFGTTMLMIKDSFIFYNQESEMYFGSLDSRGNYAHSAMSPILLPDSLMISAIVNVSSSTNLIYVFVEGNMPKLFVSSDAYNDFDSTTTFTDISPSVLPDSVEWRSFGVDPNGNLHIHGHVGQIRHFAFSNDDTSWTVYSHPNQFGVSGPNIAFTENSGKIYVYNGSIYNNNSGDSAGWNGLGVVSFETHPNDGAVFIDPTNSKVVYMTTDMGLGASINLGDSIFEINDGIEAVQVKDFTQTGDKMTAWVASKSGIRKVSNYLNSPSWSVAMFPNGDGSPYFSAEMDKNDTNTVYAGNSRIYKTIDGGNSWNELLDPTNSPYNYPQVGTKVKCVEILNSNTKIVLAGFHLDASNNGGLFASVDGGSSWTQILLDQTMEGQDVDVHDIIFNIENTDTVAYVGVEYDLSNPSGKSVYKLVKNDSSWSVSQDMDASHTSVGYQITATIVDLEASISGDTIFACGTDAGNNHPIAYYKPLNTSGLWTPLSTDGFPFASGKEGKAITVGKDTIYCAVDNEIYFLPLKDSIWTLGYQYPNGMEINFLYFDDLLVGTGTGLYGQHIDADIVGIKTYSNDGRLSMLLSPNPLAKEGLAKVKIETPGKTKIELYDLLGHKVMNIMDDTKNKGEFTIKINFEDVSEGVYMLQLSHNNTKVTQRIVVTK